MRRLLLRLRLAYLQFCVAEALHNISVTQSEMETGPKRLAHYQATVRRLRSQLAALEQQLM